MTGQGFLTDTVLCVTCEEASPDVEATEDIELLTTEDLEVLAMEASYRGMLALTVSRMAAEGRVMDPVGRLIRSCLKKVSSTIFLGREGLCWGLRGAAGRRCSTRDFSMRNSTQLWRNSLVSRFTCSRKSVLAAET